MNINNNQNKKRIKDLGIFYTPQVVVDFIFDILEIWKRKQINRWKTTEGKHKYPSVIDPSVGEGMFLKTAIAKNFTKPEWIFGLDIDENAVIKWKEINLLKEFGGIDEDLEAHFFHQNGLEKIKWEQHKSKYRYKLKQIDIENQQFDAVVGNPPYGGIGLGQGKLTDELVERLSDFEIFPKSVKNVLKTANIQPDFFNSEKSFSLSNEVKQKIKSFPIEILFLERFIQLAKPDGWITIIIPDGILTNSNADYVREFVSKRTKVEAIISLPRNTFKDAGTNAKTSILFLRKLKESEKSEREYNIFLSSIEEINLKNFNDVLNIYMSFYKGELEMDKNKLIQITKDQNGKEAVMVRVDKTLYDLMNEKPASRWDPEYWRPIYDDTISKISSNYELTTINNIINEPIIAPDHVRMSKGERIGSEYDCEYRTLKDLRFTGINYSDVNFCSDNAYKRLKRSQLKEGDVLFAGSGVGAIGRLGIVLRTSKKSCVGDLFIIRNTKINNIYLYIFLLTDFGQKQIERIFHGIQSAKISTKEIGSILIPLVPNNIQNNIEISYKKVSLKHDLAMEAKKNGNDIGYKQNIETAEKLLKNLLSDTEAVIRGEKETIN
ncbi:MAG: N-6 DNA methylase [Candidatus Humimicrobiaceae bacterium]